MIILIDIGCCQITIRKFINVNKVCCYIDFNSNDNTPNNLHFKLCYTSDDWLFYTECKV